MKEAALAIFMSDPRMTLMDVALKTGISNASLSNWSKADDWVGKRAAHLQQIVDVEMRIALKERVAELLDWNKKDLLLAKAIRGQCAALIKMLGDLGDSYKYLGSRVESLKTLTQILESTQRIARVAIGVPQQQAGGELIDVGDPENEKITSVVVNIKSARLRKDDGVIEMEGGNTTPASSSEADGGSTPQERTA